MSKILNPREHNSVCVCAIGEAGVRVAVEWEVQLFDENGAPTMDLRAYATTMLANLINDMGHQPTFVSIDYLAA